MIDREEQPAYSFNGKLPLDYSHLTSSADKPKSPDIQPDLLAELTRLREMTDFEARIQALHSLSSDRFQELVNAQYLVNQHVARLLYYKANREPDYAKRVKLATELATKRIGFHWTWYEAWFRINRYGRKGRHLPSESTPHPDADGRTQVSDAVEM